jgi:sulfur carrier protein
MIIKINGKSQNIESGINIENLLKINKINNPDIVVVQVNGEFIDREAYSLYILQENDVVDFLYFMGGG